MRAPSSGRLSRWEEPKGTGLAEDRESIGFPPDDGPTRGERARKGAPGSFRGVRGRSMPRNFRAAGLALRRLEEPTSPPENGEGSLQARYVAESPLHRLIKAVRWRSS